MNNPADIKQAGIMLQQQGLIPVTSSFTYSVLIDELANHLNELLVHNFAALIQLLYRLDIPEQKLKATLANDTQTPAARQMAILVLDRQIEKMKTRRLYMSNKEDIAEEDRWEE